MTRYSQEEKEKKLQKAPKKAQEHPRADCPDATIPVDAKNPAFAAKTQLPRELKTAPKAAIENGDNSFEPSALRSFRECRCKSWRKAVEMAVGNSYPERGRGIRKGQALSVSSEGSGEEPAFGELLAAREPAAVACDYEKTVAGIPVGVRLHPAADMEALGYYGVGSVGVCGASLVGEDALEALWEKFTVEGSCGEAARGGDACARRCVGSEDIGLAIARVVFGEASAPSLVRHEGVSSSGGFVEADTFVLASFPEDAPESLVAGVMTEGDMR